MGCPTNLSLWVMPILSFPGGERGIRTLDALSDILPFQGSPFNRSGISPFYILLN